VCVCVCVCVTPCACSTEKVLGCITRKPTTGGKQSHRCTSAVPRQSHRMTDLDIPPQKYREMARDARSNREAFDRVAKCKVVWRFGVQRSVSGAARDSAGVVERIEADFGFALQRVHTALADDKRAWLFRIHTGRRHTDGEHRRHDSVDDEPIHGRVCDVADARDARAERHCVAVRLCGLSDECRWRVLYWRQHCKLQRSDLCSRATPRRRVAQRHNVRVESRASLRAKVCSSRRK
jgi:hypothetical protein